MNIYSGLNGAVLVKTSGNQQLPEKLNTTKQIKQTQIIVTEMCLYFPL